MLFGIALIFLFKVPKISLSPRQLYLLTSSAWFVLSLCSALPFLLSSHPLSITDAVFEAVSGVTTTGSTVISGLQDIPKPILLWRSLLQWIGGLGVIGMAVTVLPFLRIGGMRLFQTESSDWSEKTMPRFQQFAKLLVVVYLALTLFCALGYRLTGMSTFDAINHAMTTIPTGGYATDDRSMARFGTGALWVAILFMLLSGIPFILYIRALTQRGLHRLRDPTGYCFPGHCPAGQPITGGAVDDYRDTAAERSNHSCHI